MREAVVFIHGIWMLGVEMMPLRHRIKRAGFACYQFNYHSLIHTPAANARRLDRFLASIEADVVHLVAHSLGGIVALHLFEQNPWQRPGRILMLGTPLRGSALAGRLYRFPLTRPLLGRSTRRGLLGATPARKVGRELGVIAGTRALGMATLLPGVLAPPHDGAVTLAETQAADIHRHLSVPYSHMGMLLSSRVKQAIVAFLRTGEFDV